MKSPDTLSVEELIKTIEEPQYPNRQGLDPYSLEEVMKLYGVPGVSVAVIKDFKIHWAKGFGLADVGIGAKVTPEIMFQAASISKPVTGMAVLKAAEDGKFSMDDDINTLLKSWKVLDSPFHKDQPVTPRTLCSHTSGLGYDKFGFSGYLSSDIVPTTVQILNDDELSNTGPVVFERPPMTARLYSGMGFIIMQLALADALGKPFSEILQEYVLEPLGMTQSTFEQPLSPERDKRAARVHDRNGQTRECKWRIYPELACCGLWSTPSDLATFAIEVQKSLLGKANHVLSQSSTIEMLSPVGIGNHGIGFMLQPEGQAQGWYFSHRGDVYGFQNRLKAHKIKGYGFAIMTNAARGMTVVNELADRIERAYEYDSLEKSIPHFE